MNGNPTKQRVSNLLKRVVFLITALSALIGGMIWLRMGFELSLMPTGNPKDQVYRSSQSFMPWFGCGIACIGVGLVGLYVSAKVVNIQGILWRSVQ
ncbi:hypothetical protein [Paenibacillus sedimenti]|uniref:hypothetical protein n=1 Tax=Paenibacillus sedimenti TaxID=2770274 RepID=UPI00165FFE4B|nr:hypothetical protein [Paenibacillus sedimenti]